MEPHHRGGRAPSEPGAEHREWGEVLVGLQAPKQHIYLHTIQFKHHNVLLLSRLTSLNHYDNVDMMHFRKSIYFVEKIRVENPDIHLQFKKVISISQAAFRKTNDSIHN